VDTVRFCIQTANCQSNATWTADRLRIINQGRATGKAVRPAVAEVLGKIRQTVGPTTRVYLMGSPDPVLPQQLCLGSAGLSKPEQGWLSETWISALTTAVRAPQPTPG
jgi:hypothetical protein